MERKVSLVLSQIFRSQMAYKGHPLANSSEESGVELYTLILHARCMGEKCLEQLEIRGGGGAFNFWLLDLFIPCLIPAVKKARKGHVEGGNKNKRKPEERLAYRHACPKVLPGF